MRFFLFTILACALFTRTNAQAVTKKMVDDRAGALDTISTQKQSRVYIINGILYDETENNKIDSALNSYDSKYLIQVDFLSCKQLGFVHCLNNVILVTFAYDQKAKIKRALLKKVQYRFVDNYYSFSQHILDDSKDPVLYIDDILIHHTEARDKLRALNFKNIYYIDNIEYPVSLAHYGQNAKNGLVRIWTRPE